MDWLGVLMIILAAIIIAIVWKRIEFHRRQTKTAGGVAMTTIIPLEQASAAQIEQFIDMMAMPENTRNLGTGDIWGRGKIIELVTQTQQDVNTPSRQYFHWLIAVNADIVGYISLRPLVGVGSHQLQFRYVIDAPHRGKGYAREAIKLAKAKFPDTSLWFVIDPENAASQAVARAVGAAPAGCTKIKQKSYNLLKL
jgi:RimJ/RimL family protein N-acetyltransferase